MIRRVAYLAVSAGMLLLVLTKSRTATAALLASLATVQVMKLQLRTKISGGVAAAWIAAAGLCCLWICGFDPATDFRELFLMGRSDESESLSGRAFIWPEVIRYARERFWFGYGYEGFWTPARIEDISDELGWGLREAHNGYLEMWLWCGVIGLVFTMFAAVAAVLACLRGFRVTHDCMYSLPLGLIVFGLLNSCLESGVVVISLVSFLLGCCLLRLALFRDQTTFLVGAKLRPGVPRADTSITISGSKFVPG